MEYCEHVRASSLVSAHHVATQVLLAHVCPCHVIRVAAVEKAEAEKIAVVKAAEGDAESKYLQGQVSIPECRATLQQSLSHLQESVKCLHPVSLVPSAEP